MGNGRSVLEDRFRLEADRVLLNGTQALVRLLLAQRQRDAVAGLDTAGFVSGYRGSPLAGLDLALAEQRDRLEDSRIFFEPGLNEELAATAVWGSQQATLHQPRFDGVFGMWYGKAPGVDRSSDALRHANYAGTARHGGVLLLAGDDHGCKSSTLPSQSEPVLVHAAVPILYPSDVQELLDFGLIGWALSRYSGLWVAMKCTADIVSATATVDGRPDRLTIAVPDDDADARNRWLGGAVLPTELEALIHEERLPAIHRAVRANHVDRRIFGSPSPVMGIITAGKSYGDVRAGLERLGIDQREADRIGLAVFKVGLTWPLEPDGIRSFARGLSSVLVIEEKRSFIEDQVRAILYNEAVRPAIVGKHDADGRRVLSSSRELDPSTVAGVIGAWLHRPTDRRPVLRLTVASPSGRPPTFCSGCPHNTSTVVPEGSYAMGGIGCHGMVLMQPERRTLGLTQMGGEGAQWIGMRRFTEMPHLFQNMGDGTYIHSGSLSVRAALAAGADITFKILVNGAIGMTGGQTIEGYGALDATGITSGVVRQLLAEGVRRVAVVSDEPERIRRMGLPRDVTIDHRDRLDHVQRRLRDVRGVTAIVYDQACASELRRHRKRGKLPVPAERVFINEMVCEGCGDCGVQSNCISVEPVTTPWGRKRTINQDSCNVDKSCLRGYCPSFAVVHNATPRATRVDRWRLDEAIGRLPESAVARVPDPMRILIAGIGGSGVITVAALLATASHLEGKVSKVVDQLGGAQKNGAVTSHVQVASDVSLLQVGRIGESGAALVLGCDIVTTSTPDTLSKMADDGTTVAIVNSHVAPTGMFATHPDQDLSDDGMRSVIGAACGGSATYLDWTSLCRSVVGDEVSANVMMLGYAAQRGLLPVSSAALHRAIELNATRVEQNVLAFDVGRAIAADPGVVDGLVDRATGAEAAGAGGAEASTLEAYIAARSDYLRSYGGERLSRRYRRFVARVRDRDADLDPAQRLTWTVADCHFRLLAIKDEFEVARLWTDPSVRARLDEMFEPGYTLKLQLAPQRFFRADPETGRVGKLTFGPWVLPVLRALAACRSLRGGPLDVFGNTEHRRRERALGAEYERLVDTLLADVTRESYELAVSAAGAASAIRGFGVVKDRSIELAKAAEARALAEFREAVGVSG